VVPFESFGTVSYSPSIVAMAVCLAISEIFSVKQWCELENQVRGRSCDFLLVSHSKYSIYHFRVIWRWIILWCWNRG